MATTIRHRVNHFLAKLSDRDTESLAAGELASIARTLPADSLPSFISAVADIRPTDKPALRRHSVRLLSILAASHPSSSLAPHLPRLLAAALRRLRDPDSSVRAAVVDAVRSLAAAAPPTAAVSSLLRPLADALFHEQDVHPQSASALCFSAAVEECRRRGENGEVDLFLRRLVPRIVKLACSPAFRAKAAVLGLLGGLSFVVCGVGDGELKGLVNCLVEFLGSEEWAARNAAAMALTRVGEVERRRLYGFKQSCLRTFEARRYDKVKIVRDSMRRMVEVWKEIEDKELDLVKVVAESEFSCYSKEIESGRRCLPSSVMSSSSVHQSSKKMRIPTCRSPPNAVTPIVSSKKNSDSRVEIAAESENSMSSKEMGVKSCQQERSENNGRSRLEVKRALFEKNWEGKKIGGLKSGARIAPFEEAGSSVVMNETIVVGDKIHEEHKHDDLSLIRMQLVQIENQQSTLLNLLQRFIGSSQKGIHSLEARVVNLEIALDNMSRDITASASSRRVMNKDNGVSKLCCKLPVTDFLSSKFWRRAESRYTPRFLTYKQESQFINPLSEVKPQEMGNSSWYTGTMVVQGG